MRIAFIAFEFSAPVDRVSCDRSGSASLQPAKGAIYKGVQMDGSD
jgi:hypothetical protein